MRNSYVPDARVVNWQCPAKSVSQRRGWPWLGICRNTRAAETATPFWSITMITRLCWGTAETCVCGSIWPVEDGLSSEARSNHMANLPAIADPNMTQRLQVFSPILMVLVRARHRPTTPFQKPGSQQRG